MKTYAEFINCDSHHPIAIDIDLIEQVSEKGYNITEIFLAGCCNPIKVEGTMLSVLQAIGRASWAVE